MGHKVNPNGFRLGITTSWTSNWYAEGKTYGENLLKDIQVRSYLRKKLSQASVSRIQIDRPSKSERVTIHTARPGIVIGKNGEDIEKLKQAVAKLMGLKADSVHISVEDIRKPELYAELVYDSLDHYTQRTHMLHH